MYYVVSTMIYGPNYFLKSTFLCKLFRDRLSYSNQIYSERKKYKDMYVGNIGGKWQLKNI